MSPSRRAARVAAAVWAGVILATGLLPTERAVDAVSGGHDDLATLVGHFAAYALLGFLLGAATGGGEGLTRSGLMLSFVLAAALGGGIELAQGPLPYRDAQVEDMVVNVAGAAVGLLALSRVAKAGRSRWRRG